MLDWQCDVVLKQRLLRKWKPILKFLIIIINYYQKHKFHSSENKITSLCRRTKLCHRIFNTITSKREITKINNFYLWREMNIIMVEPCSQFSTRHQACSGRAIIWSLPVLRYPSLFRTTRQFWLQQLISVRFSTKLCQTKNLNIQCE